MNTTSLLGVSQPKWFSGHRIEIMTVGLQDSIVHKEPEALFQTVVHFNTGY